LAKTPAASTICRFEIRAGLCADGGRGKCIDINLHIRLLKAFLKRLNQVGFILSSRHNKLRSLLSRKSVIAVATGRMDRGCVTSDYGILEKQFAHDFVSCLIRQRQTTGRTHTGSRYAQAGYRRALRALIRRGRPKRQLISIASPYIGPVSGSSTSVSLFGLMSFDSCDRIGTHFAKSLCFSPKQPRHRICRGIMRAVA
jgi:hypothetical protein